MRKYTKPLKNNNLKAEWTSFYFVGFILVSCNVVAQKTYSQEERLHKMELSVSKDVLKKDKPPVDYYITLNYDFADSISIYLNKDEIYHGKVDYEAGNSERSFYPDNRKLINISFLANKMKMGHGQYCKLKFWRVGKYIEFRLLKSIHYYDLGVSKDRNRWSLTLLNALPWP